MERAFRALESPTQMPERLTESLIRRGLLDPQRAREAMQRQVLLGGALDTCLLELKLVDEPSLLEAMSDAYGLATASPGDVTGPLDERAARAFPEQWAKKHTLAPLAIDVERSVLTVLSPAPADVNLLVRLGELLELTIKPLLTPEYRVHQRLSLLYTEQAPERFRALIELAGGGDSGAHAHGGEHHAPVIVTRPLTFGEAVTRLKEARDRDDIVHTALAYAHRDLELAAMLIVHDHQLDGWMAVGDGQENITRVSLSRAAESAFRVVLDTQAHYLGPLPDDGVHMRFLEQLGRPHPRAALIVPVRIKNRTIALMYGENGPRTIPPRLAADLMLFTTHVQGALESLLIRRKTESLSETPRAHSGNGHAAAVGDLPGMMSPEAYAIAEPEPETESDEGAASEPSEREDRRRALRGTDYTFIKSKHVAEPGALESDILAPEVVPERPLKIARISSNPAKPLLTPSEMETLRELGEVRVEAQKIETRPAVDTSDTVFVPVDLGNAPSGDVEITDEHGVIPEPSVSTDLAVAIDTLAAFAEPEAHVPGPGDEEFHETIVTEDLDRAIAEAARATLGVEALVGVPGFMPELAAIPELIGVPRLAEPELASAEPAGEEPVGQEHPGAEAQFVDPVSAQHASEQVGAEYAGAGYAGEELVSAGYATGELVSADQLRAEPAGAELVNPEHPSAEYFAVELARADHAGAVEPIADPTLREIAPLEQMASIARDPPIAPTEELAVDPWVPPPIIVGSPPPLDLTPPVFTGTPPAFATPLTPIESIGLIAPMVPIIPGLPPPVPPQSVTPTLEMLQEMRTVLKPSVTPAVTSFSAEYYDEPNTDSLASEFLPQTAWETGIPASHPGEAGDGDDWSPVDLEEEEDDGTPATQVAPEMIESASLATPASPPEISEPFEAAVLAEHEDGKALLDALDDIAIEEGTPKSFDIVEAEVFVGPGQLTGTPEMPELVTSSPAPRDPSARGLKGPTSQLIQEQENWEAVQVDTWDEWASQRGPKADAEASSQGAGDAAVRASEAKQTINASLTEDSTVPDLSAEAWMRASSDVARARPLPPEVVARAAMLEPEEPVPLMQPIAANRAITEEADGDEEPVPLTNPRVASGGHAVASGGITGGVVGAVVGGIGGGFAGGTNGETAGDPRAARFNAGAISDTRSANLRSLMQAAAVAGGPSGGGVPGAAHSSIAVNSGAVPVHATAASATGEGADDDGAASGISSALAPAIHPGPGGSAMHAGLAGSAASATGDRDASAMPAGIGGSAPGNGGAGAMHAGVGASAIGGAGASSMHAGIGASPSAIGGAGASSMHAGIGASPSAIGGAGASATHAGAGASAAGGAGAGAAGAGTQSPRPPAPRVPSGSGPIFDAALLPAESSADLHAPLSAEDEDALAAQSAAPLGAVPRRPIQTGETPISAARTANLENEINFLLERLGGLDVKARRAARDALTAMGPYVLPKLIERFPGHVVIDPFSPATTLPPFADCSELLSILASFGLDAHPYVIRRLDAPEPVQRFFAVYFYAVVFVPEAVQRLVQRLHDEEPRICMLAARTLFAYRELTEFQVVLDHLHGRLEATSLTARRHAAYLIGLFRDVTAVPLLISVFDRKEKQMFEAVEGALAEITKQRLGPNGKKWHAWWARNQTRSRIGWLVDGLASKEAAMRRSAAEELRAVTGIDLGYDEDAPRKTREDARLRWVRWWHDQHNLHNGHPDGDPASV